MASFALAKFEEFAASPNAQEAWNFLLANPVLLMEPAWVEFEDWAVHCPPETEMAARRALHTLRSFVVKVIADPRIYPVGSGPLETIIRRLQTGEITEAYAYNLVESADICRNVSPAYVAAISMRNQLRANGGNWGEALQAHRVLLAALDARRQRGEQDQEVLDMLAVNDYVVIVARAVGEYADGRLFANAVRRATALTEVETRPWHEPGEIEFSLGTLHQDPYVYKRTMENFDIVTTAWRRRPMEQLGPILGELESESLLVPTPLDALTASSKYFLQSANKRTGTDRGLSLKGYLAAEVWKQVAGGQQAADLLQIAAEAQGLLSDDRFVGVRAEIDSLVEVSHGESKKRAQKSATDWVAEAHRILDTSTEDILKTRGIIEATDVIQNIAFAVAPISKELAFALWRKAMALVDKRDEDTRKGFYSVGLGSIRSVLAHPDVETFVAAKSPLQGAAKCRQRAAQEDWPPRQLAATLLSISVNSQAGDRELEGIQVLESVGQADREFADEFHSLLQWHSGILYRGMASNLFYSNRYEEAIRSYAMAADAFLATNMPVEAEEMLTLGADIVGRSKSHLPAFAEYFRLVIPELERQGEPAVVRRVQNMCREWMPLLVKSGDLTLNTVMKLLDATKGPSFASEMRAGGELEWLESEESRSLLARIERLQDAQNADEARGEVGLLDDEVLVTMYAGDEEMQSSDTDAAVLHNLQIRYDAELRRQLSGRATREGAWEAAPAQIASVLGPETALLVYYSGLAPNGNAALYVGVFANDQTKGRVIDLGVPGATNLVSGLLDALAVNVARARTGVNIDPKLEAISPEGREALAECAIYVGGPLGEMLQDLRRKGKKHLCIQPHGPLHFFPFHLLPSGARVMAEDWTITYLPNLAMLDPVREAAQVRESAIASFGIEFEDGTPHGLPKLPGAEREAQVVASAYGSVGITGSSATEAALTAAFTNARRIHVATHGLLKVSAPSFQRVYVWPDAEDDGILHAYELLRRDLRGLDLLTLSACETSLGRVDISDNCWGLSANALIAGADTVIGTSWPVENSAAKSFFGFLHQKLAAGTTKREAFRMAQDFTRSRHPQFRDWGAFCYSGRW